MTIIVGSIIFAALLIIISKIPVAIAMSQHSEGYDNRYPRDQQAELKGFGKRAVSAHQNCIEAFPIFACGTLIALWQSTDITMIQNLCVTFTCARIAYLVCYWMNIDKLRSIVWSIGFISSIWLMALALP